MNFQRGRFREESEINLIPLIDVLLVILIFLMITTTFAKFSGLEITLPTADAPQSAEKPNQISVAITASGDVLVNLTPVSAPTVAKISEAMRRAVGGGAKEPLVVIYADAKCHQNVIDVMQAAQQAGLAHLSFATESLPK